jgi:hypothetical protein
MDINMLNGDQNEVNLLSKKSISREVSPQLSNEEEENSLDESDKGRWTTTTTGQLLLLLLHQLVLLRFFSSSLQPNVLRFDSDRVFCFQIKERVDWRGGVSSITSRIFILDLLCRKIDIDRITGLVILHAEL